MSHVFHGNDSPTLGVEIELQLIDAKTLELSNTVQELLDVVPQRWIDKIKPEFKQSYCEINTDICRTVDDVRRDLTEKLNWARGVCHENGRLLACGGSHPFSLWSDQINSPGERYEWLQNAMQYVTARLVVFGLHVHVGVDSGDKAIQLCDRLLRHLPTLLALSANSPYWNGTDTGLASYRTKVMESLPTAGMPETLRNWSEYVWLVQHLVSTGFISSMREIWWDVRPHREFGTVEIRVMDMPISMNHMLGLVALTHSLVVALSDLIDQGAYSYDCHPMIAKQNKWHAARHGLDAKFVDPDTMLAVPARQVAMRLVEHCTPYAERLGCSDELLFIEDIVCNGTGADRQRKVVADGGDLRDVARLLTTTQDACPEPKAR